MSEPLATKDTAERRESVGGVLGIAFGLFLIAACVLTVVFYGTRSLDSTEQLARSFQLRELPEGLALAPEALWLPSGEQVFTFGDGEPVDFSPEELLQSGGSGGGQGKDFEPYDWAAVEEDSTDSLPARFYLVNFPASRAESILSSQFSDLSWKDLSEISAKGGSTVVGGGKLRWAGYEADWVRRRRFIEGGSFRDTMRVNLSLGRECWIGYAIWHERSAGSEEVLRSLLESLAPLDES